MKTIVGIVGLSVLGLVVLSGCKVTTTVPTGGVVKYRGGTNYCTEGQTCSIDVVDVFFDETFTAVPKPGYAFLGWKQRERGLCGLQDQPCRLYTSLAAGNSALEAFIESDEEFFLDPVFKKIAQTVSCSEVDDPNPRSFPGTIESVVNQSLGANNCNYVGLESDDLYVNLAFLTVSRSGTPITGPTGVRFVVMQGDLLPAWGVTQKYIDIVNNRSNGIVPMLYIDSDGNPDTGMPLFGVMGADYRFSLATCYSRELQAEFEGINYSWSENSAKWIPLNLFDNHSGGAVTIATGATISPLIGSSTLDISSNPLAAIRLDKSDESCFERGNSVGNSSVFRIGDY